MDPAYSVVHQWYSNLLTSRGRFDDAEREIRRAQELDPLSLIANAALGWIYLNAGRYDEAVEQCRRTLELNADFAIAWLWMGMADAERGRAKDAVATLHHAVTLSGGTVMSLASLAALVRALEQREHSMVFLAIDPQFEALRKDPAFAALLAAVEGG